MCEIAKESTRVRTEYLSMTRSSDFWQFCLVERENAPNVKFLLTVPKQASDEKSAAAISKIFERIVKILNYAEDIAFPEPIDAFEVTVPDSNFRLPALVWEYIHGWTLHSAVSTNHFAATDIYDKSKRQFADINKKRIHSVLADILDFEERLIGKGLVHLGLSLKHVIVQVDDIVKIRGLRYICRTRNGVLDDPSLLDKRYGNLLKPRTTPKSFWEYFQSNGREKPNVYNIVAYQIGLLMFDIFTKGQHMSKQITPELLEEATYHVNIPPEDLIEAFHKLFGFNEISFSSCGEIKYVVEELIQN
ncbi:hypothetical protein [Pseudothermotoga sp.]